MQFPKWLRVYGDVNYRGSAPPEGAEQVTFFSQLRRLHPHLAPIVFHPRMEGERTKGQADWQKADGSIVAGVSDVIGVGSPMLVLELKRVDHTKSVWQKGQAEFLEESQRRGAFVCVALGWKAAMEAVEEWELLQKNGSAGKGRF